MWGFIFYLKHKSQKEKAQKYIKGIIEKMRDENNEK